MRPACVIRLSHLCSRNGSPTFRFRGKFVQCCDRLVKWFREAMRSTIHGLLAPLSNF